MEEKTYKITLNDGTVISDLKLNGNNYISKKMIKEDIFNDNCSSIIINDGEKDIVYNNVELVQIALYDNEYWFVLRQLSDKELEEIKVRSDVDYIAMMTDVKL